MTPTEFRAHIWRFYTTHGRHDLPWRKRFTPYRVLVSEIMLQQTQVDRVIPFYRAFLKRFPTATALAAAPLSEVLRAWQGLGYNRRAKQLHKAAQALSHARFRRGSHLEEELEALPGVGPYTARAVAAFAFNQDTIVIETNIRTVIIHHFFPRRRSVADAAIARVLAEVLPPGRAREWYSALMDYGAYLKRSGISHNTKTKGYVKQAKFSGSLREVRGAIVRALTKAPHSGAKLKGLFNRERQEQVDRALEALVREQIIKKAGRYYTLVDE